MVNAIEIENLSKNYKNLEAVKNISFSIKKGDFFGFIGPNGAGKTTTIKSIMGLLNFSGKISVLGLDVINNYKETRKKLGLSPQEYNFDSFITVEETLYYTAGFFGIKKAQAKPRVEELLKKFNLHDKKKSYPRELSGGMKRRLIIARALVHNPEILILDEPTAGIDVALRHDLWKILTQINKSGTTIILTTHYIEEVEKLCNTLGIIHKGEILQLGPKQKLMKDLSNETLVLKTSKKIPLNLIPKDHLKISQDGKTTRITGKGIKEKANLIIKKIEKHKIKVLEIDLVKENLETIFLRLTNGGKND